MMYVYGCVGRKAYQSVILPNYKINILLLLEVKIHSAEIFVLFLNSPKFIFELNRFYLNFKLTGKCTTYFIYITFKRNQLIQCTNT